MSKEDDLKAEMGVIQAILFTAIESFKIVEYLYKPDENSEKQRIKTTIHFFAFDAIIHWRICVIELCKLYSGKDNDKYNLQKFLRKIDSGGKLHSTKIFRNNIVKWREMIENENLSIDNIIDQRDKLYAHTDRKSESIANKISIEKAKELLSLAFSIIKSISSSVFDTHLHEGISNPFVNDLDYIIETISDYQQHLVNERKRLRDLHRLDNS